MTKQSVACAEADRFIERYGLLSEEDGLPRTAGRMMALMIVEGGPFSFSGLAQRLQVSRASVSTNTRLLEQLGMIERVTRPGERQDYFQLVADPWARTLEAWLDRQLKKRKVLEDLQSSSSLSADARGRVEAMLNFMRTAAENARTALAGLRPDKK
jgi:DNA-binding transcriptional regulator GbsR (MarR family)